ncbi:hypothetical protein L7F22_049836 [Adiantum nelumboides]|nr:hypothetical protein [Adiantum nelumboides]
MLSLPADHTSLDPNDAHDCLLQEPSIVTSSRKMRGRPRKSVKRGRPKHLSAASQEDAQRSEFVYLERPNDGSLQDVPESSNSRIRGLSKKKISKKHSGGRPKLRPSQALLEGLNGDDDDDSHASFGEGVDCDDATLEVEGGVLDDDEDGHNGWHEVAPHIGGVEMPMKLSQKILFEVFHPLEVKEDPIWDTHLARGQQHPYDTVGFVDVDWSLMRPGREWLRAYVCVDAYSEDKDFIKLVEDVYAYVLWRLQ